MTDNLKSHLADKNSRMPSPMTNIDNLIESIHKMIGLFITIFYLVAPLLDII